MPTSARDIAHTTLQHAITAHRHARIVLSADTASGDTDLIRRDVNVVRHCAKTERAARRVFAPFKRAERIAARVTAIRAKRYAYQIGRRSRTLDQGAELRTSRAERRHAAALATMRKRQVNAINGAFAVPDRAE